MLQGLRLASPSPVKQAPNAMALMKSTQLVVAGQPLSTPPMAQDYFEPGVNTKLNRRKTPKTNYELPSDLPKYPLGFVPLNQTPGAAGEEPAEIRVKESAPADLLDVFAKISAQQMAESKAVEEAKVLGRMDIGSLISQQYKSALSETTLDAKVSGLVREGFSQDEAVEAVKALRMEEAIKKARGPPKAEPMEQVLAKPAKMERDLGAELEKAMEKKSAVIGRRGMDLRQLFAIQKAESKSE